MRLMQTGCASVCRDTNSNWDSIKVLIWFEFVPRNLVFSNLDNSGGETEKEGLCLRLHTLLGERVQKTIMRLHSDFFI